MSQTQPFRKSLEEFKARPEHELLLLCARVRMDPRTAGRLRALLKQDLDESYLIHTAARHRMLPLLSFHLKETCPEEVSPGLLKVLDRRFQEQTRVIFLATGELIKVLAALEEGGIGAIPFKGPVLAQSVYGNLGLRPFSDLDVLVRRKDALRAKRALDAMGYSPESGVSGARAPAALRRSSHHYRLLQADPQMDLDLHWELFSGEFGVFFDPERLFERAGSAVLGGLKVRTLAPDDLLLFLCAHGGKHSCDRLLWLVDIAELIRAEGGIDWEGVFRRAGEMGIRRMLCLCLLLVQQLLGSELPPEVRRLVTAEPRAEALADFVLRTSFHVPFEGQGLWVRARFHLLARERRRDRWRYCLRFPLALAAPTPLEWSAVRLPNRLYFLYYAVRPLRLAAKYGRRFLGRAAASRA